VDKAALRQHKRATKELLVEPSFRPLKRKSLPKPFHKMGGGRAHSTGLIDVSDTHSVLFVYRTGDIRSDTSFYAYLMCKLRSGQLSPLMEFHYHPSHKDLHCKLPCRTTQDYTERLLPQAPELQLGRCDLDPRAPDDRLELIWRFCAATGIHPAFPRPQTQRMLDLP
jgi:hypothetical protein